MIHQPFLLLLEIRIKNCRVYLMSIKVRIFNGTPILLISQQ